MVNDFAIKIDEHKSMLQSYWVDLQLVASEEGEEEKEPM